MPNDAPLWVAVYFAFYLFFTAWSFCVDIVKKKVDFLVLLEFFGSAALTLVAAGYWYWPVRHIVLGKEVYLFFVGLFALVLYALIRIVQDFLNP